ncbi:hypothetical protein DL95DRAFT_401683 [Leptodontidium sp. 2 PMI_412]|nr:hypothetical protein DL95DRAFT_401683 [Leptodontidium sp. 2 PMI_412]
MSISNSTGCSGLSWADIAAKPNLAPKPTAAPPVEDIITPTKSKRPSIAAKLRNTPTLKAKVNIKSNGSKLPVVAAKPKSTPIPQAKAYTEAEVQKALSTPDLFDWADEMEGGEPATSTPVRSLAALAPNCGRADLWFPVAPREPQVEKAATPHFPTDKAPRALLDSGATRANPLTLRTWRRTGESPTFDDAEPHVEKVATPHFPTNRAPRVPLDSSAPRVDPSTLRTWRRTREASTFDDTERQAEKAATHFPTDRAPRFPLDSSAPRVDPSTLRTWRRTSEAPTFSEAETRREESALATQKTVYEQPLIVASAVVPEVLFQETGPSSQGLTGLTHLFSIPLFSIAEEESIEPEAPLDETPLDEARLDKAALDESPLHESPLDEASPIELITLEEQETAIVKTQSPSEAQPLSIETGRGTEESQTVASVTPPESSVPSEVSLPPSPPETPSPVVVSKFRLRAEAPSFVPGRTEYIPSPSIVSKFGFRAEAPSFVPGAEYIPSPAVVSSEWCTHRLDFFQSQRQQREHLHAFLEQYDLIREVETRPARLALLGHYPGWGKELYY